MDGGTAYSEAKTLFRFAGMPGHNTQEIRNDILPSKDTDSDMAMFRLRILKYYDSFTRIGRIVRHSELPKSITYTPPPPSEPKPPKPSKYDNPGILQALRNGESVREVAMRFGCSRQAARALAKRNGVVPARQSSGHKSKLTDEQVASLLRAVESGTNRKAIASEFGISPYTVSKIAKKTGITPAQFIQKREQRH